MHFWSSDMESTCVLLMSTVICFSQVLDGLPRERQMMHPTQKVCGKVNRKCPPRNSTVQLSTLRRTSAFKLPVKPMLWTAYLFTVSTWSLYLRHVRCGFCTIYDFHVVAFSSPIWSASQQLLGFFLLLLLFLLFLMFTGVDSFESLNQVWPINMLSWFKKSRTVNRTPSHSFKASIACFQQVMQL